MFSLQSNLTIHAPPYQCDFQLSMSRCVTHMNSGEFMKTLTAIIYWCSYGEQPTYPRTGVTCWKDLMEKRIFSKRSHSLFDHEPHYDIKRIYFLNFLPPRFRNCGLDSELSRFFGRSVGRDRDFRLFPRQIGRVIEIEFEKCSSRLSDLYLVIQ